jgi:hypothetical protein
LFFWHDALLSDALFQVYFLQESPSSPLAYLSGFRLCATFMTLLTRNANTVSISYTLLEEGHHGFEQTRASP